MLLQNEPTSIVETADCAIRTSRPSLYKPAMYFAEPPTGSRPQNQQAIGGSVQVA